MTKEQALQYTKYAAKKRLTKRKFTNQRRHKNVSTDAKMETAAF